MKGRERKMKTKKVIITLLVLVCLNFLWVGFHNVDNTLNALKFSYDNDIDFYSYCDQTALGGCIDYLSLYMIGMYLMYMTFFIMAVTIIYLLSDDKRNTRKEKKKRNKGFSYKKGGSNRSNVKTNVRRLKNVKISK